MLKRLFIIVFLFFTPFSLVKAQSDAPFLYYYESASNRFLIERADGQDRFVLVEDALPEDYVLRRQGWSPSGRWLMWTASEDLDYSSPARQNYRAWMVSADGTETLPLLDDLDWTITVEWSPVADYLLVTRFEEPPVEGVGSLALYVIDVNTQQIILHTGLGKSYSEWYQDHIRWSDDGAYIFYWPEAEIIRIAVPTGEIDTIPDMPRKISESSHYNLRYDPENQILKVTDMAGNTLFEKFIPGIGGRVAGLGGHVEWNPQNTHALVFAQQDVMGPSEDPIPPYNVWLVSITDQSITHIIDNATAPDISAFISYPLGCPITIWTPEGDRALFPARDGLLYWFNLDDSSIENTELPELPFINSKRQIRMLPELGIQWTEDYGFIMWGEGIWVYDRKADQFLDNMIGVRDDFGISYDERYLAQLGYVWDLESHTAARLLFDEYHSLSYPTEVLWHTTSPWVMIRWRTSWIVSNPTGTIQRYIFYGWEGGWLPENVNTSHIHPQPALPTVIPQMLLQGHQSYVVALDWSPDGSTIASLSEDGELRLWDAHTGEAIQIWHVADMPELKNLDIDIVWGNDSQTLAVVFRSELNTVQLWDSRTGRQFAQYAGTIVAFNLDRQYMLLVDEADKLLLWDMETHTPTSNQAEILSIVLENVFSPDGNPLISEPEDFRYVDNVTVNPDGHYYTHCQYVFSYAVSGNTLAKGCHVREMNTGEVIAHYAGFGYETAWSPDSTRLAIAEEHLIRIWVVPE